jgi:simple sugar transport system ATP-binding protein
MIVSAPVRDISQENLVAAMVGAPPPRRATEIEAATTRGAVGAVKLEVSHLGVDSTAGSVQDVSLAVAAGECVGLVGLNGSGSATVADTIVGLVRPRVGEIRVGGRPVQPGHVDAVLSRGVGYVPQDRHARGFAPQLGLRENLTLSVMDRLSRWGLVQRDAQVRLATEQVRKLQIVAGSLEQPVSSLSGGNQQKVTVGRALAQDPEVLVVVNPTVGVDVASKEALLDSIADARDQGRAILLVSDDFEDLRVCTRLLVMVRGQVRHELDQPPWDRETLIAAVEGLETTTLQGRRSTDG